MASRFSSEIVAVITAQEWDFAPNVTTLRVALYGGLYADTENPTGPNVHYQGRIKSDIILDKKIGVVFWNEGSTIDFGYLDLATEDQDADIVDFAAKVTIATVDIYRVNIDDPGVDQLELATSSRSSDIGFVNEDMIRFRLESILQGGFDAPINLLYYDDTYTQLEGKPYLIAWGNITYPQQLLPTTFVDDVTLLYHVTDLGINSFDDDVYDKGIALVETTNFVAASYGFTLLQNPAGGITVGSLNLEDPIAAGEMTGLFRFVRLATTRGGIWANVNQAELTTLQTRINKGDIYPQFFADHVVTLEKFMDEIFAGTGSWYYVDELSQIHFGGLINPDVGMPELLFTDAEVVGEIKVEDDKAPGLATRLSYAESPGAYEQDELAGGVTNAKRLLITNKEYICTTTEPVISFYEKAITREPIKLAMSYSISTVVKILWSADLEEPKADSTGATADGLSGDAAYTSTAIANIELDRWWSELYPVRRRFYTFTVMLNDPLFDILPLPQLGGFFALQSDRFALLSTAKNLFIKRMRFDYSSNKLTLEGWG